MREFPNFLKKLPELDIPFDGVSGHLLQGESQQVAFVSFSTDTHVPEHSHRGQWELVIAGKMELQMKGESRTYQQGESFFIPDGVEHGANVTAGYRAVIFFDQADKYQAK